MRTTILLIAKRLVCIVCLCHLSCLSQAEESISYGVQPFLPPVRLERLYGSLIASLSEDLGTTVVFRTRRSIAEYQQAINSEAFDIILVSPFEYDAIRDTSSYLPVVQRKGNIKSVVYVIDQEIDSLDKLRGKIIGFPPKESAIGALGIQVFTDAGITLAEYQARFFNDHLSCKQAMVSSQVDACAGSVSFAADRTRSYNKAYYAIATSRSVPSSVIMLHQRNSRYYKRLQDWFLSLNKTDQGQKILQESFLGELEEFNALDYESIKNFPSPQ